MSGDHLHLTARCPQSPAPPLSERMEQKFFITPNRITLAQALLLRTCRLDPQFPVGQVTSVYFDTMDLDQHERSTSGELVKDKVRIRWYGEEHDPYRLATERAQDAGSEAADHEERVRVWLELKSRRGFCSTKQRASGTVPRSRLALPALGHGIVPRKILLETMADFGFFPPGPIRPIIVISYFRRRFVEPFTGYRLSIDSHVRSTMLLPGRDVGERALELPGAVVEVKCPFLDLPASLLPLAEIGSSWSRFSKYSACVDGHEADRGTVSRLWPSGSMEAEPGPLARVRPKAREHEPPERRGRKIVPEPTTTWRDVPLSRSLLEQRETE